MATDDDLSATAPIDPPTRPVPVPVHRGPSPADDLTHRPGATVHHGRYRLLTCHGSRAPLEFWQAYDAATRELVALTLVDPRGALPVEFVNEILSLTVRLRGVDTPGVAPIIDVAHTGAFGLVAAEWVPGGTLRELADTLPSPVAVAGALEPLAVAAEAAHRAGLHLSIDHPARVRLRTAGHAVLAFPATLPDATRGGDLRGIGGCLYALLAGRWPDDTGGSDWPALETGTGGEPAALTDLRPGTPFLVSTTAAGLVRPEPGITSAATLVTMLRQASQDGAGDGADIRVLAPLDPPPPGVYAGFRNFGPGEQQKVARQAILRVGMGAAAAIAAIGVVMLGSSVNGFLPDTGETAAMDPEQLGLNDAPRPTTPAAPAAPSDTVKAAAADSPVIPAKAEVYSPDGRPDNPGEAGRAIDGDPATAWSTDRYYDAEPFPKFKEGLGLMLELAQPTALGAVTVDLGSSGTVVQVRSAGGPTPAGLADTAELSAPTSLKPGSNTIALRSHEPVSHVLVWVGTLGSTGGESRTAIAEVTLRPQAPPA
ncbi:protein kinase family protein [Mycobacterium sp. PS03-16]|uniref:protein kinase family protein n=1 Tax=Mycobacterium sp. PS03-16 TaxID=2559611 RepID=UPI001ADDBD26|nr:protein kinase family protein [Mycobacterium sp. PS03-16]